MNPEDRAAKWRNFEVMTSLQPRFLVSKSQAS